MAKPIPLFLLLLSLTLLLSSTDAISEAELNAAISSLRSRGYHLFGNAIITSDVRIELLLSNDSFTLFAPTDAAVFSLDMASPAAAYVRALRYHVSFGRFPFPALRSLPDGAALRTLLPYSDITVSHRRSLDSEFVTADGVDIVLPGVFYGRYIAVHGLAGILVPNGKRSPNPTIPPSIPPDSLPRASRSPDPLVSPSIAPDLRVPPFGSAVPPPVSLSPPSIAPDSGFSLFGSADPPDLWMPARSPTISPASASLPPTQPGIVMEVAGATSPAVNLEKAAPIPIEVVFPGGKQGEGSYVLSPPVATAFSWDNEVCLHPETGDCTDSRDFGRRKTEGGGSLARDDAL